jgi:5'(3')-deoxyribonucleotidase
MDNVLADFDDYAMSIVGHFNKINYPQEWAKEDWEKIKSNQRIFKELNKMPLADDLVDVAMKFKEKLKWQVLILTAIPKGNDFPWAFHDKMEWAKKHYPEIPVHFGPYSKDKKNHCKKGFILVDDKKENCEDWIKAGGIAIRVKKDYQKSIDSLNELFVGFSKK